MGYDATTPDAAVTLAKLEAELAGLKAVVAQLEAGKARAESQADAWQAQAERATIALAAPARPWWKKLTGG